MENKIITYYDRPPIPTRRYDWQAIREDYDEGHYIGTGETELEAVTDLLENEK